MIRVLFVCLGNICRSPTAHGVFETLVEREGLSDVVQVDSCGTGSWHIGEPPDKRATAHAEQRGYQLVHLRARQVQINDFHRFDYILAMDEANLNELKAICPPEPRANPQLFLCFGQGKEREVPDPYYGGEQGFEHVLDLVESASEGLLAEIKTRLAL